MIVVTIELRPKGDKEKAKPLGVILITNDSTGDSEKGNYDVIMSHAGKYINKKGCYKQGKVVGHRRSLSPYHLVYAAIKACLRPNKSRAECHSK